MAELYRQIGQLKVELDWLQKKRNLSVDQKRRLVEKGCGSPSVVRQCELLALPRASFYYQPVAESPQNLLYMRLIDEQYTKTPFYGVPRLTVWLGSQGHVVNRKRVARLMQKMGWAAIYPKANAFGHSQTLENVSLSPEGIPYHQTQPSLGNGYHLHSLDRRVSFIW